MKRLLAGMLIVLMMSPLFDSSVRADQLNVQQSLTNPLRKYVQFKALRPFGSELKRFTDQLISDGYASEISVYFRSFNDGVWIGVNERGRFAPASLMKVPIMMAYLKEAETNGQLLNQKFAVETADDFSQYIQSKVQLKKGELKTVEELIELMIRDSNNDAMKTLVSHANTQQVLKMYDQLGYSSFINQGDFLSLKAYAGTFRLLYNATFLNESMSEKALKYLTETNFFEGIVAGLPKGVIAAHKFGEYGSLDEDIKQLHDVGIVYHPENPYLLGIMTRGKDYAKLAQVIERVSAFIYKEVNSQYESQQDPNSPYKFEDEA